MMDKKNIKKKKTPLPGTRRGAALGMADGLTLGASEKSTNSNRRPSRSLF